jgi:hypothetical protein
MMRPGGGSLVSVRGNRFPKPDPGAPSRPGIVVNSRRKRNRSPADKRRALVIVPRVNSFLISPRLVLAALVGSLVCNNVQAVVINGNFGSGLAGWSAFGDVSAASGAALLTTASLDQDDFPAVAGAFNVSGTAAGYAGGPGGLEEASGLALGALDLDFVDFASEGSAVSQSFNVSAGQTLSFSYQFFTNEGGFLDYAYYAINGTKYNLAQVADATAGSSPFFYQTGLLAGSHFFAAGGTVNLSFGVVDVGDFVTTSALLVDNVSVPDSATTAVLLAVGMLGCGALRRRRVA